MDSLLASYASDDEDEQEEEKPAPPPNVSLFGHLPAPRNSATNPVSPKKESLPFSAQKPKPGLFSKLPPPRVDSSLFAPKVEVFDGNPNDDTGASKPSLFAALPPPKVEEFGGNPNSAPKPSLFAALPPPKVEEFGGNPNRAPKPSLFAALPPPKVEEFGGNPNSALFAAVPPPKVEFDSSRVKAEIYPKVKKQLVAFKPPIDVSILEDDDDDWRPAQKKAKAEPRSTTTGGGGLSSLLPAPKHSLGLGSTLGAGPTSGGRRAAMEIATPDVKTEINSRISISPANVKNEAQASQAQVQYDNSAYAVAESSAFGPQVQYSNEAYGWAAPQPAQEMPTHNVTSHYEPQNWQYSGNVSSQAFANSAPVVDPVAQVLQAERQRGREDRRGAPTVIEVKQADLTGGAKLREDQIRSTGIAFGPAYQPVSSKDKPSKIQRRKHQIGTLLQDSKAKEMDLLDRRAKGNLTKAETQAKYGW